MPIIYQVIEIEHHRDFTFEDTVYISTDFEECAKIARSWEKESGGVVIRMWQRGKRNEMICTTMDHGTWHEN